MMEESYRIPNIEEFVQGFKFQIFKKVVTKFMIIDSFSDTNSEIKENILTYWEDIEVWWKHNPISVIREKDKEGNVYTVTGIFVNFLAPYDDATISEWIKKGKIRVKI